jgi:hypothetical protein
VAWYLECLCGAPPAHPVMLSGSAIPCTSSSTHTHSPQHSTPWYRAAACAASRPFSNNHTALGALHCNTPGKQLTTSRNRRCAGQLIRSTPVGAADPPRRSSRGRLLVASTAAFFISGVVHEIILWYVGAQGGFGWLTFFTIQVRCRLLLLLPLAFCLSFCSLAASFCLPPACAQLPSAFPQLACGFLLPSPGLRAASFRLPSACVQLTSAFPWFARGFLMPSPVLRAASQHRRASAQSQSSAS